MSAQDGLAEEFFRLSNEGMDLMDQTIKFRLVRNLVNMRHKINNQWFISKVGAFLYKYRKEVTAGDFEFFMKRDYADQRAEWMEVTRGYGEGIALAVEEGIKTRMGELYENNAPELHEMSKTLLGLYCQWRLACRET
jgi:hypothetical protein